MTEASGISLANAPATAFRRLATDRPQAALSSRSECTGSRAPGRHVLGWPRRFAAGTGAAADDLAVRNGEHGCGSRLCQAKSRATARISQRFSARMFSTTRTWRLPRPASRSPATRSKNPSFHPYSSKYDFYLRG